MNLKEKLLLYGFDDWQVERLMKVKKLNSNHGVYTLDKKQEKLFLDGKEISLEN